MACIAFSYAETKITKQEYVQQWSGTAILEMVNHKVPASITIAQGILESGSGNSNLAKNGNNHFGIKCHEWTGDKMYVDDDKKGECFRVYAKAEESFADHSVFLTGRSRYSKLFTLDMSDYKGWAKGLKEAGYATNPKYPDLLIAIIEDLKLYELDVIGKPNNQKPPAGLIVLEEKEDKSEDKDLVINKTAKKKPTKSKTKEIDLNSKSTRTLANQHTVKLHENQVKYVIAKKGDTYFRISEEFGMALWQLYKYNDFSENKDVLEEGDIVYLQPKRFHAKAKNASYKTPKSMNLVEISQIHALRIKSLKKLNGIEDENSMIPKGTKILLR